MSTFQADAAKWPAAKVVAALFAGAMLVALPAGAATWDALEADGIHDPANPALEVMQQPAEALSQLPGDPAGVGNKVRWIDALRDGYINPRTNIYPETEVKVLDLDVVMKDTGSAAYVRFPHRPHTEWLDCANCHDKIFPAKAGATPMTMLDILNGEYCGRCHGAVAFPLILCDRCHSVSPDSLEAGSARKR